MWRPVVGHGVNRFLYVDGSDMDLGSYDDSEQFEDGDSDSSIGSENIHTHTWAGWNGTYNTQAQYKVLSLIELSARATARNFPFEVIETHQPPIPEALQLRIAFWSFPEDESEIRLYSCLACGSAEKFQCGEKLVQSGDVKDVIQIGFHLSGVVTQPLQHSLNKQCFNVAISFDRGKITSCQCTCKENVMWCEHTIAVCLFRIKAGEHIELRAPVSESLSRLERDQLQKFAQYLISELPQQILPTAQRLLDELLLLKDSTINSLAGAPDPTAGASLNDETKWVLDECSLRDNIKKILARYFSFNGMYFDEQYPPITPAVTLHWTTFIQSFQPKKPEAMWNLLSIVRHMMRSSDINAVELLGYLTEECMFCYQMMFYWVSCCVSLERSNQGAATPYNVDSNKNSRTEMYASSHFMEEVVHLWELVIMNPHITDDMKNDIRSQLASWDTKVISAANKGQGQRQGHRVNYNRNSLQGFSGFNKAVNLCDIDWSSLYDILDIPKDHCSTNHQIMSKLNSLKESSIYKLFMKAHSLLPDDQDEFAIMSILSQALYCHGYVNKSSKLASMLAQRILSTYPQRLRAGESDFSPLIDQANRLCEILEYSTEYKRTLFELAMLGLTAPRQPARSNLDEVKVLYLEICLYKKLKSVEMTEERLTLIRHQAKKVLTCPTLRGEEVLPLLLVTYIFEVLCKEMISSSTLQSSEITWAPGCETRDLEDMKLGYKCALRVLGVNSNASNSKNSMLCESIRNQRKDLSLSLFYYSRFHEEEVANILEVVLDRRRYNFMTANPQRQAYIPPVYHNTDPANASANGKQSSKKSSSKRNKTKEKFLSMVVAPNPLPIDDHSESLQQHGVTFADILAQQKPPSSSGRLLKKSSDSDSGNGEGTGKEGARLPSVPTPTKKQQSRRQSRHPKQGKGDLKSLRNAGRGSVKPSKPHRQKKLRQSREVTESDSGQEMHFSFEKDEMFVAETENWDDESLSLSPQDHETYKHQINQNDRNSTATTTTTTTTVPIPHMDTIPASKLPSPHQNEVSQENEPAFNIQEDEIAAQNIITATENLYRTEEEVFISNFVGESSSLLIPQDNIIQQQVHHGNEAEGVIEQNNDIDLGYSEEIDAIDDNNIDNIDNNTIGNIDATVNISPDNAYPMQPSNEVIVNEQLVTRNFDMAIVNENERLRGKVLSNESICSSSDIPIDSDGIINTTKHNEDLSTSPDSLLLEDTTLVDSGSNSLTDLASDLTSDLTPSEIVTNNMLNQLDSQGITQAEDIDALSHQLQEVLSHKTENEPDKKRSSFITAVEGDVVGTCAIHSSNDVNREINKVDDDVIITHDDITVTANAGGQGSSPINVIEKTVSPKKKSNKNEKMTSSNSSSSSSSTKSKKKSKKKNKEKLTMNLQSIEAEAYSMFELAKCLFSLHAEGDNTYEIIPLAALEIGLFALNIHNYSSPNWCSRTYSTYVKWIENHCVELGVKALQMLNEKWEGVLTPTECVSTALRASRVGDPAVKRTSAELILSCLAHSQSLSSTDITACLNLCRQIGNECLERACSAVENASTQGGIQPELLFRVSRDWHYLHEERRKEEQGNAGENESEETRPRPPVLNNQNNKELPTVYITAEQFVQEQMHLQAQEILGRQLPRSSAQDPFPWMYPQYIGPLHHCPLPQQAVHSRRIPNIESYSIPYNNFPEEVNLSEIPRYLQNCYRVGMRAMEALALPLPDERPERKYASSPPCSEDIRWMCALSASLGPICLKNFCKVVYNAVTSPFLLHDLALEAARHFALYNPAQLASHLRSPSVSPIVQKAMAMYTELVHHDLVFLSPACHNDFVDLLKRTRSAFCMAPGGMTRFNDILDMIRKTYPKKRDLWIQIMNGLSTA